MMKQIWITTPVVGDSTTPCSSKLSCSIYVQNTVSELNIKSEAAIQGHATYGE